MFFATGKISLDKSKSRCYNLFMLKVDEDKLLQIRSAFGRWRSPDTGIAYIISEIKDLYDPNDIRKYRVKRIIGYKPIIETKENQQAVENLITKFKAEKFNHEYIEFPELQQFFRSGEPITGALILQDALLEIETEDEPMSGLEALMKAFR